MRKFVIITMLILATVCSASQSHAQGVLYAPLLLFTNGAGNVSPLQIGQSLEVGQSYEMEAIPDDGYVFSSWQPVNVFTSTLITFDGNGNPNPPIISNVESLVPDYTEQSALEFIMQPVMAIIDQPNNTITESSGWRANFVPVSEPSSFALIVCGITTTMFLNFTTARRERRK